VRDHCRIAQINYRRVIARAVLLASEAGEGRGGMRGETNLGIAIGGVGINESPVSAFDDPESGSFHSCAMTWFNWKGQRGDRFIDLRDLKFRI
jgi:hypothetical protein